MGTSVLFWRRTDVEGLERLELTVAADGVTASGSVICLEDGGFRLDHRWRLDTNWRVLSVEVERWNAAGHGRLLLECAGNGWIVDGAARPDLDRFRIAHSPTDQGIDLRRDGSGKQRGVTVPGTSFQDPLHVRQKTHVQHAIRLVEHHKFNRVELASAL